jgi:hypothetical protein
VERHNPLRDEVVDSNHSPPFVCCIFFELMTWWLVRSGEVVAGAVGPPFVCCILLN